MSERPAVPLSPPEEGGAAGGPASAGHDRFALARRLPRADRRCLLALVALVALLCSPRLLGGPIDLRWDAGVYYVLGTALQQGKGYRLLNEPGEIQAVQYPPGLPLLVAAHQVALGSEEPTVVGQALRWTYAAATLAFVLLGYALARTWLPPLGALAVGAIVALHPWTLFMSDSLFAELPFGVALLAFLLVCRRARGWRGELAAGALLAVAFLLRTLGVALMAAWVGEALLRRRWRHAAARAALAAVPLVAWQGWVQHVRTGPDYARTAYAYQRAPYLMYNVSYADNVALFDPFDPAKGPATPARIARRTAKHALRMPRSLGEMVSVQDPFWREVVRKATGAEGPTRRRLAKLAELGLGLLVLGGLALLARRGELLVPLLVGATAALICLSPWEDQFVRYLTPLIPPLAACLVLAASVAARALRARGRGGRVAASAGLLALAAAIGGSQLAGLYRMYLSEAGWAPYRDAGGVERVTRRFYFEAAWSDFDQALAWLRGRAERDAVVVTVAPHWTWLETGRRAVQPPRSRAPDEAQRLLDSVPASYVIVDGFSYSGGELAQDFTPPAIVNHPDLWRRVFVAPSGLLCVFQRVGQDAPRLGASPAATRPEERAP